MLENMKGFVFKRISKQNDSQKMEIKGFVFNVIKKRKNDYDTPTEEPNKNKNNITNKTENEFKDQNKEVKDQNSDTQQKDYNHKGLTSGVILPTQNKENDYNGLNRDIISDPNSVQKEIVELEVTNKDYDKEQMGDYTILKQNSQLDVPENSIISPKIKFKEDALKKPEHSLIDPNSTIKFEIKTINPPKASSIKSRPSFLDIINRPSRNSKTSIKLDPNLSLESGVNSLLSQLIAKNNFDIKFEPVKISNPYDDLIDDYKKAIDDVRLEIDSLENEVVKWNVAYEKTKERHQLVVPEKEDSVFLRCEYKRDCKYRNVIKELVDNLDAVRNEIRMKTDRLRKKIVKKYSNGRVLDPVLLLKKFTEM